MYYFTPKRCQTTGKIEYISPTIAQQEAFRLSQENGVDLYIYQCTSCHKWHLTHSKPLPDFIKENHVQYERKHSRKGKQRNKKRRK